MSLLDSLFQLLAPQLEGVELRRAWGPGWGSRLVRGPVVSGEVLSARWAGHSQETQVRLTVFAPEASQRREIGGGSGGGGAAVLPRLRGAVPGRGAGGQPNPLGLPAAAADLWQRRRCGAGGKAGRQNLSGGRRGGDFHLLRDAPHRGGGRRSLSPGRTPSGAIRWS